ncbi:Gfo/Idh/MocA family oxidoreductase [Akkermansiaceae bacterium]|nr:Gfo/Idh/MocA family oxidoreductase [Akkermansiaceae bacterium]MDB4546689.1 Gfo/Idh/MocA family oxidoreductase [Akkermansiaceae bacterium]
MNRRNLLRSSLYAGTFSLLAPHARAAGANGELRIVVIGVKGRGSAHINGVISHKKARLVGLCDIDTDQLDRRKTELEKRHKLTGLKTYTDYRKVCQDPEVDAICIATCNHTHTLIALSAAAAGKHVYVEKPVSHNVWEGEKLALGQADYGVTIAHGFQRRSEQAWHDVFAWVKQGEIGKLTLARGFCYKPRKSIGKVSAPVAPPKTVDYDLWSGPREVLPIRRSQFHYDWHWQSPYGNGDLGNQGPHQLDVCRWALGDPMTYPTGFLTAGGRVGYDDDGDTANTQILYIDAKPAPILFEVRGLPKKGLNWKNGMPDYQGVTIGNVIEYEGGKILGGHGGSCEVVDHDGKVIKKFKGSGNSIHNFIDDVRGGKQDAVRGAENGHHSSALAHLGTHALNLGKTAGPDQIKAAFSKTPTLSDAHARMQEHLAANGVTEGITLGVPLTTDGVRLTGEFAAAASKLDRETYRDEFKLPNA